MSKVEDLALKTYPVVMTTLIQADEEHPLIEQDCNKFTREAYIKGYNQAEKDLELTWEDMRELYIIFAEVDTEIELCKATDVQAETIGYYQEVLKRYKDLKERKEK